MGRAKTTVGSSELRPGMIVGEKLILEVFEKPVNDWHVPHYAYIDIENPGAFIQRKELKDSERFKPMDKDKAYERLIRKTTNELIVAASKAKTVITKVGNFI